MFPHVQRLAYLVGEPRLAVGKGGSLVAEDTSSGNTLPSGVHS